MASKETADKEKKTNSTKQIIVPHITTHQKDQHFIPEHKQGVAEAIHDSIKEEKVFHNKEEVALLKENDKVKAAIVFKTNRKRIYNSQGRR